MIIGIIGAENSHAAAIAKTINIEKKVKGFSVDYIWGETEEFAKQAAEAGNILNIVKKSKDMLGKIDALIVDHRHPKYHLAAAQPFVEEGVPTFIDKPFCYDSQKGKDFLKTAKQKKAPVTSFSVLPHQKTFSSFLRKIEQSGEIFSGSTYGPCDLKSKWGGVFFYGIHQVDLILHAFGYNPSKVKITKNGGNAAAEILYPMGKIVTMNLIKEGVKTFGITALSEEGFIQKSLTFDENPYLTGVKTFTKMFKTGEEPIPHKEMLKPVQVLEAIDRALKSGEEEKIG